MSASRLIFCNDLFSLNSYVEVTYHTYGRKCQASRHLQYSLHFLFLEQRRNEARLSSTHFPHNIYQATINMKNNQSLLLVILLAIIQASTSFTMLPTTTQSFSTTSLYAKKKGRQTNVPKPLPTGPPPQDLKWVTSSSSSSSSSYCILFVVIVCIILHKYVVF